MHLWSTPLWHLKTCHERKVRPGLAAAGFQTPAVILAGAAPPQNLEDLCTVFALSLLTPPASPLRRKTVLEYRFDHFVCVLWTTLIPVSGQSVGPNPSMNVFSLLGSGYNFKWRRIPAPVKGGNSWNRQHYCAWSCICRTSRLAERSSSSDLSGGLAVDWLTSRVLLCSLLPLAREQFPQSNPILALGKLLVWHHFTTRCRTFALPAPKQTVSLVQRGRN